jgi:proteasome lid subunit RPN8/RPN11
MNSTALNSGLEVWQSEGCAVRIDYSRSVMEELRLAASDGLKRLKNGIEIGGVLFGFRDSDSVKIMAHRALACEYAFGPTFTLSNNDRRVLEELMLSPDTDSRLSGMHAVGWYHSHTRAGILLCEKDQQLFQHYFPETWQIALVLRVGHFEPVRATFFFREPDGSVLASSSRHEFIVKPVNGKQDVRLPADGAPADTAPHLAEPTLPEPAPPDPGPQPPAISRHPLSQPEPRPLPAPRAASRYPQLLWVCSAAGIAVAVAVALALMPPRPGGSRASAGLSVRDLGVGNQLRIDWNHSSRVIEQGQSGALEIEDGLVKWHQELSQEYLRVGSMTYLRNTGSVLVRLLVRGADQSTLSETSLYRGPPPPAATAVKIGTGSADRFAKKDEIDAVPVSPDREREAEPVAPAKHPSNQPPQEVHANTARAGPTPASAPGRHRLVLPPAVVPRPAEPILPAPPAITANTVGVMTPIIPRSLPAPAPAPPNHHDQGPQTGKIIWTGKLTRGGTIQILGNRASQGHITGGLPGVPVRVQVFPSELIQDGLRIFAADPGSISPPEAPGAQNGWNRTVYVLNPRKAGEVAMLEAPGQANTWNRLTLRAERGDHSIIVLRWERVPAESAPRAAGNR